MNSLCKCGCGNEVRINSNTYLNRHNPRTNDGFKKWRENHPPEFIEKQKKAGKQSYRTAQEKNLNVGAKALEKWRKENPIEFLKHQSEHGKISGKIGGANTVKNNPGLMSKNGKRTHLLHPEQARNSIIKLNKDFDMARKASKIAHKKHPDLGKRMTDWLKKNKPEHFRNACIKSIEKQSERGFVSKPEKIMRKLLPSDFLHNRQLGYFVPDFHSPERMIVIEVDGDYWHSSEEIKNKDKLKNKHFHSLGYKVFRFPEHDVNEYLKPLVEVVQ